MGKPNFSDEFKRDAVAQITERGYPVAEVSQRLGVSQHSLYPSDLAAKLSRCDQPTGPEPGGKLQARVVQGSVGV